ncbi:hypothetical protein NE865_15721 [Phthorimaea operculella]|nr:hypothetical protein NE865_15721 [Phthorimaea operculella]
MFRAYCHEKHGRWASVLPQIEELYNNTTHDSTGFTPCQIMYGKPVKMTFDKYLRLPKETQDVNEIREQVRKNLVSQSEMRKAKFDSNHKLVKFQIGDLVKLKRWNISRAYYGETSKFDLLYEGPYVVAAVPFENVYILQDPDTKEERGKFNAIHISRYYT